MYQFENESDEARKLRSELLEAEIALKDQVKRVAELRRRQPGDTVVEGDYRFQEIDAPLAQDGGKLREVSLVDLFEDRDKPLVLMHFMYGKKQQEFCPMCTMWADGYDGVVPHLRQRMNFAVLVAGDVGAFRRYGRARGWRHLRAVGDGSALKRDCGFEDEDGGQSPGVSVFTLGEDGRVRHFLSTGAVLGPDQWNGMDLLSPVWNYLDLTPEGRTDFMPRREYER